MTRCDFRSGDNECISEAGHLGHHTTVQSDTCPECASFRRDMYLARCCKGLSSAKGPHLWHLLTLAPLPPLRWCQHCGDSIEGQGRRVCAMCEADVAEREEHRG
jgi:hypothetical protein